jgi:hypothetical protein
MAVMPKLVFTLARLSMILHTYSTVVIRVRKRDVDKTQNTAKNDDDGAQSDSPIYMGSEKFTAAPEVSSDFWLRPYATPEV